jgi:hypothetical protein
MQKNPQTLAGDLQIIKKTVTPTEYKGYLKCRILELRLLCSEPECDVKAVQYLLSDLNAELESMTQKQSSKEEDIAEEETTSEKTEGEF